MKKIWLCLLSLGLIMALCSCGGKSVPDENQIKSEIPDYVTELTIDNPFGGSTERFEITSLEIEKRQTEDKEDTSWCLIQMQNDYYSVQRYVICYYNYYDKGGWILDDCEFYYEDEVEVRKNPFDNEDVIDFLNGNYGEVNIEKVYPDECGRFCFEFDATKSYPNVDIVTKGEYNLEFNGIEWHGTCDSYVKKNWNITGEWDLDPKEEKDNLQFSLSISEFDSDAMTAKGTCSFYYSGAGTYQNTYQLEDAEEIYEENDCLYIVFKKGGSKTYVVFSYDRAKAQYSYIWSNLIFRVA